MKIRIEMDPDNEEEVLIRCKALTPEILKLQQLLTDTSGKSEQISLFKGNTEYFLEVDKILFFETENSAVVAHTANDVYETTYKLYELEEMLTGRFLRISKSAIVNIDRIFSINRILTASSTIEFQGTHKQVFVSRAYYKLLKERLEEKRYRK